MTTHPHLRDRERTENLQVYENNIESEIRVLRDIHITYLYEKSACAGEILCRIYFVFKLCLYSCL